MESGFSQETAAKMVNSALVLKGEEGMFSTVDICAVDLYTGICNFLKAGAASTFIKRDHWVESITSEKPAKFLGYEVTVRRSNLQKRNKRGSLSRVYGNKVRLKVTTEVIKKKLLENRLYVRWNWQRTIVFIKITS